MGILEELRSGEVWQAYLAHQREAGRRPDRELEDLAAYIERREYLPLLDGIRRGERFPLAEKRLINKMGTGRKRTVYAFDREAGYLLKLCAHLLHRYDGLFAGCLYSFRLHCGVKQAVRRLCTHPQAGRLYAYKVDIHDYFNSVDVERLLPILRQALADDPAFFHFLRALLTEPCVRFEGGLCEERRGIMAGMPVSSFLANLYLSELDWQFQRQGVLYARYSDDIIVFAESAAALETHRRTILDALRERGLTVNPSKERWSGPGKEWEYLGFSYRQGEIDLSAAAADKLRGKLKRRARALYRWKRRGHQTDERAIRAYIAYFNRKFYENPVYHQITWCRWYFPILTTAESLRAIDRYMIGCIRYLTTGRYTRANYALRYETIRALGFRSLVHEYYRWLSGEEGTHPPPER